MSTNMSHIFAVSAACGGSLPNNKDSDFCNDISLFLQDASLPAPHTCHILPRQALVLTLTSPACYGTPVFHLSHSRLELQVCHQDYQACTRVLVLMLTQQSFTTFSSPPPTSSFLSTLSGHRSTTMKLVISCHFRNGYRPLIPSGFQF